MFEPQPLLSLAVSSIGTLPSIPAWPATVPRAVPMRPFPVLVIALALWALPGSTSAQTTGSITGTVTGTGSTLLSAAQVYIPDTGLGVLTNASGRFLILNVPVGDVELRVELVGHRSATRTVTVVAGGAAVADFSLTTTAISLDEIVVTGTGKAFQKKQLGNTVATLEARRLENAPVSNFSELLQGREPGVVAFTSDGATGSGTRIRVRGSNSLSMSNEPVVYVDGMRVDNSGDMEGSGRGGDRGSRLDDINWEAVERVEILKGAAAATLYGSEASSGVIQIITKSGSSGPARLTARVEMGTMRTPDGIAPQAGFARSPGQAEHLSSMYGETIVPFEVFERDFVRDMLEQGGSQAVSADVSGGADNFQYYLSARYSFEDGTLGAESLGGARDHLTRIQSNASVTFLPREGLSFRVTTGYTDTGFETFGRNNDIGSALSTTIAAKPERANCFASALDPTTTFGASTPVCTGAGNPVGAWIWGTPRELMQFETGQDARHFNGSLNATWEGGPGLSVQALVGLDQVDERYERLWPFGWRLDGVSRRGTFNGRLELDTRSHREVTFDAKASWSTTVASDIQSDLVVGGQRFYSESRFMSAEALEFPAPGIQLLGVAETVTTQNFFRSEVSLGGYVQEQIGYRDWLYVTLGARLDRTSAFGKDAGSAFYPKAGVSAILSELPSWNFDWLPTLRVRAALGKSGLQPGVFDKETTYFAGRGQTGPAIFPGNLGNPDLRPERSTEVELGVEGEVLGGRLGLDVTYWDRTTHDALIGRQFPLAAGFGKSQLANIGRLDSHGWEFQVNGLALESDALTLNLFANAAYMRERVTDMGGSPTINVSGSYSRHLNVLQEGQAPGAYLGAQLIPVCGGGVSRTCYTPGSSVPFDTDRNGVPDSVDDFRAFLTGADARFLSDPRLGPMLDDEDGDGDLVDHYLGKPTPDWQGSFGADLTLGSRLSITSLFEFRTGNYSVSNLTKAFRNSSPTYRNTRESAEVESTLGNPDTRSDADARMAAAMTWATELAALSPWAGLNQVESGDFVRWRELGVTYRVPDRFIALAGVDHMTVTLTGRNLAVWTSYTGADPEASAMSRCGGGGEGANPIECNFLDATDTFTIPLPRRYALSVRVVF
jgi:TonB-dependent starch-binding outer membrane protein SusC